MTPGASDAGSIGSQSPKILRALRLKAYWGDGPTPTVSVRYIMRLVKAIESA
jgi:hypothetical protein